MRATSLLLLLGVACVAAAAAVSTKKRSGDTAATELAASCCYVLTSTSGDSRAHLLQWRTGASPSQHQIATAPGLLRALDNSAHVGGLVLGGCAIAQALYRPRDSTRWLRASDTAVRSLLSIDATGRLRMGPYVSGTHGAITLQQQLNNSAVLLELECLDSAQRSCLVFGMQAVSGNAGESPAVRDLGTLAGFEAPQQCSRGSVVADAAAASSTSTPPSVSSTPSASSEPAPTHEPAVVYEHAYTARVPLNTSAAVLTLRFQLCRECLLSSQSARGAHFCDTPVSDADGAVTIATLVPASEQDDDASIFGDSAAQQGQSSSRRRRLRRGFVSPALQQHYHALAVAQSRLEVFVLWRNGGYCRVDVDNENTARVLACRAVVNDAYLVYAGDALPTHHYTGAALSQWSCFVGDDNAAAATPTPSRPHAWAGGALVLPSPSASGAPTPAPEVCQPEAPVDETPVDSALYALASADGARYLELTLGTSTCSRGTRVARLSRTSALYDLSDALRVRTVAECTVHARQQLVCDGDTGVLAELDSSSGALRIVNATAYGVALRARALSEAYLLRE
jgi:hypothetical protein